MDSRDKETIQTQGRLTTLSRWLDARSDFVAIVVIVGVIEDAGKDTGGRALTDGTFADRLFADRFSSFLDRLIRFVRPISRAVLEASGASSAATGLEHFECS